MADAFSYKLGMRLPSRIITLSGNGLTSLDLIDPGSIKFVYRRKGVVERNEITATIVNSAKMQIAVDFGAVDTDEIAQYQWHVEARIGALPMAFPEVDFYTFSITGTIAAP
jgi:hypothetical protein